MPERPDTSKTMADITEPLKAARAAFAHRKWREAYHALAELDHKSELPTEDLERLATAAYLIGHDEEFFSVLERIYHARVATDVAKATRCAFWLGLCLLFAGKPSRGSGWLSRAHAHVEAASELEVEGGFLLLPQAERQLATGEWALAQATARRAAEIGSRLGEADLRACARHQEGRALIGAHEVERGLMLLDEAMLDVTGGALSPIMTGLVYCSVIDACQEVYAVGRAREWTHALASWCEEQPQMIAFSGTCLVHRAELMQLAGQWPAAIDEARRACERYAKASLAPAGGAFYRQGEVYRLRGNFELAENAYREASASGYEPQPGLALLRLSQGSADVACGSIRRLLIASDEPLKRAQILPACVEIMIAAGETDEARKASEELADIANRFGAEVIAAAAAQAEAAVCIAEGNAQAALAPSQRAFHTFKSIEAPYEAARARILTARACLALGDEDAADLELDAAVAVLKELGAEPDLARARTLRKREAPATDGKATAPHGLTPREREVLRHVAMGKTNKAIAADLFVSEKTVERHLSNIFNKLDVSSRTAAAAFAFEHKLA